jgi:hypothetical protein
MRCPTIQFRCAAMLLTGVLALRIGGFCNGAAWGAETSLLTGDALQHALAQKIGITWSNITLRQALASVAKTQHIAVLLDRRVDPDQKVELTFENIPLEEALERIASRLKIGVTILDGVAYFGPPDITERLRTVATLRKEEVDHLPTLARTRWMQSKPWQWEILSTPRDLAAALAQENNLQIDGLAQIPHDLWPAADLPPLPLYDRWTLLLAPFDLTYELSADGNSLRLVPMPEHPTLVRSYSVSGAPQEIAAQLRLNKLLSSAEITVNGNKLQVRGRQEDQEVVRELLSGRTAKRTTVSEGRKVYTLRVELPVGELLEALSRQIGFELQLDRPAITAAGVSLEKQKVKVDVKDASADELLKAVLDPAGLTFVRHENVIEVKPK